MFSRVPNHYGPFYFWVSIRVGDLKMEEEATEILSENKNEEHVGIIESADGLQFTQNKPESEVEATVGFSKQGHVSYKGDFKNDKPHGLWTTFFRMVNPDGREIKEGLNHGKYTMWYENGRKRMEGSYENGKKHGLSIRLQLQVLLENGNINSIISGTKRNHQRGIIKEILFKSRNT